MALKAQVRTFWKSVNSNVQIDKIKLQLTALSPNVSGCTTSSNFACGPLALPLLLEPPNNDGMGNLGRGNSGSSGSSGNFNQSPMPALADFGSPDSSSSDSNSLQKKISTLINHYHLFESQTYLLANLGSFWDCNKAWGLGSLGYCGKYLLPPLLNPPGGAGGGGGGGTKESCLRL